MKILLPSDGSELALAAVHHALQLVREGLSATFVLANVQEPTHLYEVLMAPDAESRDAASREAGEHALVPAEALLRSAGIAFEREVVSGDPAQALIEIAEDHGCDAIIIGSHGKGSLRSALLGSVSQALLHAARIPVTVVRHGGESGVAEADTDEPNAGARGGADAAT